MSFLNEVGSGVQSLGKLYINILIGVLLIIVFSLISFYNTYEYRKNWTNLTGKVLKVHCDKGALVSTVTKSDNSSEETEDQTWNCNTTVQVNIDGKKENHNIKTIENHDASLDKPATLNNL